MRSASNAIISLRCSRGTRWIEAGIVAGGEGILLAADLGDVLREGVAGIFLGALEHQMFEEMRQAGFARRLVGGADLVPDHVGDDRRAMIGDHHDFKTVASVKSVTSARACAARRGASVASAKMSIGSFDKSITSAG